ncbi:glutathione-disulfide reductase [Marinomonas piezotolerans]|uniref:Glutathione-disulfide reductase n=1 Tax=Marinomonas piezotolerans TaxID=2213058 RepID=A0A370UDK4_9GAMM|nr:glutathione-disulfide reductase [Marinomonas piezotolerans]RDL45849.1 glutathione-disulfide reductase [Marinomonas piezotolerans]
MDYQYDLFVIGAGSGGVRASRIAASKGFKVGVAEASALGGTCVNIGCVPKKLFVYGSEYSHVADQARGYGWEFTPPTFNWTTLRDNKTKEIERLNGIYKNLLENPGVTIHKGVGKLLDAHTVQVGDDVITSERILIAVGAEPFVPDVVGRELALVSDDMFYLDQLPSSILIVGGGYIAVEFAGICNGLGVTTTLMYRGDKLLRGFDDDVREFATEEFAKSGINVELNSDIAKIEKEGDQKRVTLVDGRTLIVGEVLYATGRKPKTAGLNLEAVGVETTSNGAIVVDNAYRSSIDSIYAVGDVTDKVQLTPVAIKEAMALIGYWFDGIEPSLDYDNIPTAVFCQPPIGTVGLSEQEADKRGFDIDVYQTDFRAMKHTLSGAQERSFMKLIVDRGSDRVLGAHMVGDYAGEIIQGLGIAIKAGATKAHFDSTVGVHPTSAEEFVTFSAASLKKR